MGPLDLKEALDVDNYRPKDLIDKEYGQEGIFEKWKAGIDGVFVPIG